MKEVMSELRALSFGHPSCNPARYVIQGGYFESGRGFDAFALASLRRALELGDHLKEADGRSQITYSLLINDLGISCTGDVCDLVRGPTASAQVQEGIDVAQAEAGKAGATLSVVTERQMRNWGFRRLRKMFKMAEWESEFPRLRAVVFDERTNWTLKSRMGEDILLFEENASTWVAKCPVIMGAYYACMLERAGDDDDLMSKVVIDLCAPSDRDKVSKGAEAACALFRPRNRRQDVIMPVLCDPSCATMLPMALLPMDLW